MTDKEKHKSCAQLVRTHLRSRMADLNILWKSRCVGEQDYDEVKELYERQETLNAKYLKKLRKGARAVAEYEDAQATIKAEVRRLSGDQKFVYKHFESAESLGGYEAFYEYGLSLDYVEWDAKNQYGDFIRWQVSYGGPSDEFQFYTTMDAHLRWVEYRYMDWFDGAGVVLKGADEKLLKDIFEDFRECGVIENIMRKWREDNGVPTGHSNAG